MGSRDLLSAGILNPHAYLAAKNSAATAATAGYTNMDLQMLNEETLMFDVAKAEQMMIGRPSTQAKTQRPKPQHMIIDRLSPLKDF